MGKASRRKKEDKPKRAQVKHVYRPFEGLPWEAELVAMREIIPAATLRVQTSSEYGGREVLFVTLLPQMLSALRRSDGVLLVAVQAVTSTGDASRDLADRLMHGLELEAGQTYAQTEQPEPGERLQDILDYSVAGEFELYEDFAFWVGDDEKSDSDIREAINTTREQLIPTRAVPGIEHAFWARMQREFVRWVRTESEDTVLAALARLQTRRELGFSGARFVGAFRALGLLIPVFELEPGTEADELTEPMKDFARLFEAEIASPEALTPEEKRAKAGIVSRQVTLR